MYSFFRKFIDAAFAIFNIKIIKLNYLQDLELFLNSAIHKKSQLNQDLFVAFLSNFKREGFFVEVGAADGIHLSNTYLLEKSFDWHGILIEPAHFWHQNLEKNRDSTIHKGFIGNLNKKIIFFESSSPDYSTNIDNINIDGCGNHRRSGLQYELESETLTSVLNKYKAPEIIDYLSIDTEGSDYSVLCSVDFIKYKFNLITCEHNYMKNEEKKINKFLLEKGYIKVFHHISKFESWYIHQDNNLLA